jgi:hypothetical protein
MPKIYFYKLTCDDNGAPCVQDGLLSLAICKPMIRGTAQPEDLIFGFAANSLRPDNRLLYIARVTGKVGKGDYYVQKQFAGRGDCIYERRGSRFMRRTDALQLRPKLHHHPDDLVRDLGQYPDYPKANVLLSRDFRYFGANGSADYKSRFPRLKKAVEALGRGHRVVQHDQALWNDLMALKRQAWEETHRMVAGPPTSTPRRSDCHRSKSCAVLSDD